MQLLQQGCTARSLDSKQGVAKANPNLDRRTDKAVREEIRGHKRIHNRERGESQVESSGEEETSRLVSWRLPQMEIGESPSPTGSWTEDVWRCRPTDRPTPQLWLGIDRERLSVGA